MEFTGFTFEHTFTNVSSETLEIFFHRVSDRYGVSFLKYGGNFPSSQILVIPKNILLRNVFWSLWNRWITQRELVWNRCYLCTIQTVVVLNWMIWLKRCFISSPKYTGNESMEIYQLRWKYSCSCWRISSLSVCKKNIVFNIAKSGKEVEKFPLFPPAMIQKWKFPPLFHLEFYKKWKKVFLKWKFPLFPPLKEALFSRNIAYLY